MSFLITAMRRGELKDALAWSDDPEPEKKDDASQSKAQSKSEDRNDDSAAEPPEAKPDQQPIANSDDAVSIDGGSGRNLRSRTRRGREQ